MGHYGENVGADFHLYTVSIVPHEGTYLKRKMKLALTFIK